MAFGIEKKTGLDALWRGTRSVLAALSSHETTQDLAAEWEAQAAAIEAVRRKRDQLELDTAIARARVRVADAEWDLVAGDLYRKADDLGDRKPDAEPRRSLFGGLDRGDMLRAGAAKAVLLSGALLAKLPGVAALASFVEPLRAKSEALDRGLKARTAAEQAEAALAIDRVRLRDEVEALAYRTEAILLQRFPGQRALVRAFVTVIDADEPKAKSDDAPEGT